MASNDIGGFASGLCVSTGGAMASKGLEGFAVGTIGSTAAAAAYETAQWRSEAESFFSDAPAPNAAILPATSATVPSLSLLASREKDPGESSRRSAIRREPSGAEALNVSTWPRPSRQGGDTQLQPT